MTTINPAARGISAFIIVLASIALCVGILGFHFYTFHLKAKHDSIRTLAHYAASLVDPAKHQQLIQAPRSDSDLYSALLEPLVRLHMKLPDVSYLYTMIEQDGRYYFVLDTATSPQLARIDLEPSDLFEEYVNLSLPPDWLDALHRGETYIDQEPVVDEYGRWISISVPVMEPDGTLLFWLGMDFNADEFLQQQNRIVQYIVLAIIVGLMLSLGIAFAVYSGHVKIRALQQTQQTLTLTDSLTGAYNRRFLKDKSAKIWLDYKHSKQACAVLVMDIDHFKAINDRYGHDVGDQCLIQLVNQVNSALRAGDFLIRMGGEEFLILFSNAGDETALVQVAERIRTMIEELEITHDGGETLKITISIGVSPLSRTDKSLQDCIRRADGFLYQAKDQGRNRVVFS